MTKQLFLIAAAGAILLIGVVGCGSKTGDDDPVAPAASSALDERNGADQDGLLPVALDKNLRRNINEGFLFLEPLDQHRAGMRNLLPRLQKNLLADDLPNQEPQRLLGDVFGRKIERPFRQASDDAFQQQ